MKLGERICHLRTKAGMSQSDLADRLGVSRQSVSKWETNSATPDLDKLVRLADIFQISLDELVTGAETEHKCSAEATTPQHTPEKAKRTTPQTIGIVLL